MNQNCIYSVPLNGQGNIPSSTEPFQFSQVDCSAATSSFAMNLFPQTYSLWQGAWIMLVIVIYITFFFKNR